VTEPHLAHLLADSFWAQRKTTAHKSNTNIQANNDLWSQFPTRLLQVMYQTESIVNRNVSFQSHTKTLHFVFVFR